LRYDDKDSDYVAMNEALWELCKLDENDYPNSMSFYDYLKEKGFSDAMLTMANGGFANTLCTNSKDLSLKQCIKWYLSIYRALYRFIHISIYVCTYVCIYVYIYVSIYHTNNFYLDRSRLWDAPEEEEEGNR
jgi:hypothetical protein